MKKNVKIGSILRYHILTWDSIIIIENIYKTHNGDKASATYKTPDGRRVRYDIHMDDIISDDRWTLICE